MTDKESKEEKGGSAVQTASSLPPAEEKKEVKKLSASAQGFVQAQPQPV